MGFKVHHIEGSHGLILGAIQAFKRKSAAVGFMDTARYPSGELVSYIATIQEFGYPAGGIPARPFFRPTIAQQKQAWRDHLLRGARQVLLRRITLEAMLRQFAMAAAGDVATTISKIQTPPLSPSTIAARQARRKTPGVSTKPLVDTGLMIQSVTGEVIDK
ncbi:hypothetical protein [Azotobacter salinestris]|uniref:hypothetical protein n=1 Tax=Azotobacter salinestris TaxID=69964 RepID=UPI001AD7D528|nr:hypothetical protein [Azotobacter salinestris]